MGFLAQPNIPAIKMVNMKQTIVSACNEVRHALEEYGCFLVDYCDGVTEEINMEVYDALKPLFDLPIETKVKNTSPKAYHGYVGQLPFLPLLESMGIENATSAHGVNSFTNAMWSSGNSDFCKMIQSYAKLVSIIEETVRKMVFESYGVQKYHESYNESVTYLLRVMKYRPPSATETKIGSISHTDKTFISILSQNQVNGLEVKTKDGNWIPVEYPPSSFLVMAGDAFKMTNNPAQNQNNSTFRSMFEREKLTGPNFNDWYHSLRIVLRVEEKTDVLENQLMNDPGANAPLEQRNAYAATWKRYNDVACLMLASMSPELKTQFEYYDPYNMINELKSLYQKSSATEIFDLVQSLHTCKLESGKPISPHVLCMKSYLENLARLNFGYHQQIAVGIILSSLSKEFEGFVRNYNMHDMQKTIVELHSMLVEYEKSLPKKSETPVVMLIKGGRVQKKPQAAKGTPKEKGKQVVAQGSKPKKTPPAKKEHPAKNEVCHHCGEVGHWRRNCPVYLAKLMKKRKQATGSTGTSRV